MLFNDDYHYILTVRQGWILKFGTWYVYTVLLHNIDVIMTMVTSQITSPTVVNSIVYSDQRKHQSSASLAFVRGIHRDRWISRTKGQWRGNYFHLMTSSWSGGAIDDCDWNISQNDFPKQRCAKPALSLCHGWLIETTSTTAAAQLNCHWH